jgi:hypothetical protein
MIGERGVRRRRLPTDGGSLHRASFIVSVLFLLALLVWFGLRPGWASAGGDFANYYTAARVVASGEDLTPAYSDFLWFQQHVDAAGFANQLAGFIPHPPATALVMLPLVGLPPLAAKRVWIAIGVLFALACALVLGRLAGSGVAAGSLALLATGVALWNDFAFGQMYLPLLLSLSLFALLVERSQFWAGVSLGAVLLVKPFALPLVAYCLATRRWRAVAGCVASSLAVAAASVAMLGRPIYEAYVRSVLPHQLAGRLQDPFHPLWQSWGSLARRMFMYEPTLNPTPAANLPWVAGAIPALAGALGWSAVALVIYASPGRTREHLALLVVASLAVAPGGATYHLVLLALVYALVVARGQWPVARLGMSAPPPNTGGGLLVCAALLALPLPWIVRSLDGGWSTPLAYPRLWLLTALGALVAVPLARGASRSIPRAAVGALAAASIALASIGGIRAVPREYDAASPVSISAPEITGPDRAPIARPSTRGGTLTFLAANPATGAYERFTPSERVGPARIPDVEQSALSPNGRFLAYVSADAGNDDVWVRDLATGAERRVTLDPASDREPRWEDDSHIVFSTDRGRGLAYTTLYRIGL